MVSGGEPWFCNVETMRPSRFGADLPAREGSTEHKSAVARADL